MVRCVLDELALQAASFCLPCTRSSLRADDVLPAAYIKVAGMVGSVSDSDLRNALQVLLAC